MSEVVQNGDAEKAPKAESPTKRQKTMDSGAPRIINLTPHDIVLYAEDGKTIVATFKALEKKVARAMTNFQREDLDVKHKYGLPCVEAQEFTGVQWPVLGTPQEGMICENPLFTGICDGVIVSMPVGNYLREQAEELGTRYKLPFDVLGPDMGPKYAVRDDKGRPIGTKSLCVYAKAEDKTDQI